MSEAEAIANATEQNMRESPMFGCKTSEPKPSDFKEAAEPSQGASIADESAAYQTGAG